MTPKPEYLHTVFYSALGPIRILTDRRAIIAVGLNESPEAFEARHANTAPGPWKAVKANEDPLLKAAVKALEEFFSDGKPLPDGILLNPTGTSFQQKVWKQLRKIPHGQTITYGQIAEKIGSPEAARAVGTACGANPLPLFIPCHRVIGSGGDLRGFGGGGVEIKKQLLDIENTE